MKVSLDKIVPELGRVIGDQAVELAAYRVRVAELEAITVPPSLPPVGHVLLEDGTVMQLIPTERFGDEQHFRLQATT